MSRILGRPGWSLAARTMPLTRAGGAAAAVALVLLAVHVNSVAAQVPGWDPRWPPPEKMLQGRDPAAVAQFNSLSAALARNPEDVDALVRRGILAMSFARSGLYSSFWRWLAAKDLEQAIQLDPNNFYAWHNYGHLNYVSGGLWMMNDHSNAQRAVTAFTKAI